MGNLWHRWVWSTHVEMHFVSSKAWSGLFKSSWDTLRVVAGMGGICSTHVAMNLLSALAWEDFVNTSWDTFCVVTCVGWVWWIHAEIDVVSSLELDKFFQYMLLCILCPRWLGRGLVNTCWDAFYVLAGMGCFLTLFEMHFVTSMGWMGFGQHMLRCIFVLNTS